MNTGNLTTYKSELDEEKIKRSGKSKTKKDRQERIVSNIYGLMGSKSKVTKEEIKEELKRFYG